MSAGGQAPVLPSTGSRLNDCMCGSDRRRREETQHVFRAPVANPRARERQTGNEGQDGARWVHPTAAHSWEVLSLPST